MNRFWQKKSPDIILTRKVTKGEKREAAILSWLQNFHRERPQDTEAIIGDNVEVACRVSFSTS